MSEPADGEAEQHTPAGPFESQGVEKRTLTAFQCRN